MTRGDYLELTFMYQLTDIIPIAVAIRQKPPTHPAYVYSSIPVKAYYKTVENDPKLINHIPVAVATAGGTSKAIKS